MRAIVASILVMLVAGCATVGEPHVDTDYVLALSSANTFLEAWRSRDQDSGLALLSDRLLKSRSEDEWRLAISGVSNPHHQSYEITRGHRLEDGRIQFSVWLYEHYTGERQAKSPRQISERIIVRKVRDDVWRIDEVPQL